MLLSEVSGISPTIRTFRPSSKLVSPTCAMGIEIEVENVRSRINVNPELWNITDDGSLRNSGMELVSTTIFGEDILTALDDAENALDNIGVEITHRCGLHLHMDVSSFNTEQLISLACATALAEGAIYNYVGQERRDNIYCLPFSGTSNIVPFFNSIKYGETTREIHKAIKDTTKYSGFNILPILRQGSVEYRHHPGTYKADTILRWINIVQQLRETALAYNSRDLLSLPYNSIKRILFGQYEELMCGYPEVDSDLQNGWMVAKDILNFNKLEDAWANIRDIYRNPSRVIVR